jgi:hypothetical protein
MAAARSAEDWRREARRTAVQEEMSATDRRVRGGDWRWELRLVRSGRLGPLAG